LRVPKDRVLRSTELPAAGPLQLRRGKLDTLKRGAELSGASEDDLLMHADLALDAGAKVLAELGAETGARRGDLASWNLALEEMSGFADDAHRTHYAHQVFATLARGGRFVGRDGEVIVLPPHDLPPSLTLEVSELLSPLAVAEYQDAEWIPTSCTNKCYPTRSGTTVDTIVIHDTEGSWTASVATLQNDPGKSVQYIVNTDGHVAQFVTEATGAWHSGNATYNLKSVGIEHVGYTNQPFTEPQYAASAKLVDYLTNKYAIPKDRVHVIGHDQVPNGNKLPAASAPCSDSPATCEGSDDWGGANNHRDPGIWEWATYMPRFQGQAKCNDVTDLWRCSYDSTKRLRCADGNVAIDVCAGSCAASPSPTTNGAEASCVAAPATTIGPAPSPFGSSPDGGDAPSDPPPPAEAGCSLARPPGSSGEPLDSLAWATLALAMAGAVTGRRRVRRNG
jgi:N-acetyl-anhydromuramyl-L-alanine amidase AmpD